MSKSISTEEMKAIQVALEFVLGINGAHPNKKHAQTALEAVRAAVAEAEALGLEQMKGSPVTVTGVQHADARPPKPFEFTGTCEVCHELVADGSKVHQECAEAKALLPHGGESL